MLLIRIYCDVGGECFNEFTYYDQFSIGDWGSNLTKKEVLREFFGMWGEDDEEISIVEHGENSFEVSTDYEPKYCKVIAYPATEDELITLSKFNVISYVSESGGSGK